jgi:hypothetical protein
MPKRPRREIFCPCFSVTLCLGVDLLPETTVHGNSLTLVPEILREHGLL